LIVSREKKGREHPAKEKGLEKAGSDSSSRGRKGGVHISRAQNGKKKAGWARISQHKKRGGREKGSPTAIGGFLIAFETASNPTSNGNRD